MRLTKDKVLAALYASATVDEAATALGATDRGIRSACRRLGLESPANLLGQVPQWKGVELVRGIVIPDLHAPYHDARALGASLAAIRLHKPHVVVILGDWVDCYDISDFTRSPGRRFSFEDELAVGNVALDQLEALHVPRVIFCEGNHENRLPRYLAKRAPELYSMITMKKLLRIEERGWEWVGYEDSITIGKIHFSHEWGMCGKYAAQRTLAGTGRCTVAGHTHRAQLEYGGTVDGERHVAAYMGWLGDVDQLAFSYKKKWQAKMEWIKGFGAVTWDETGRGQVDFCPIIDGRAIVWGKMVDGRSEL